MVKFFTILFLQFLYVLVDSQLPFDYGLTYGDSTLPKIEGTKQPVDLSANPLNFLDQSYETLYVDEDGAIWLGWHCDDFCPIPTTSFPVQAGKQMVACYWADTDNSVPTSQVYYRLANDSISWNKARSYLAKGTGGQPPFDYTSSSKQLLIVTWFNVTYDGGNTQTSTNTFQCALMSDGKNSYGLLSFQTLSWYTSPLEGNPALVSGLQQDIITVGIDTGNANFENLILPNSGTTQVTSLASYTNFRQKTLNSGPNGWSYLTQCSPIIPPYYPLPPSTTYETCTISGDPHYYTFDGANIDQAFGNQPSGYPYGVTSYQKEGHYILFATANCHSTNWPPVSIVAEVEPSDKSAPPNQRTLAGVFGAIVTFYWNTAGIGAVTGPIIIELRSGSYKVGAETYTGSYDCPPKNCANYSFSIQPVHLGFQLTTTFGLTVNFDYSSPSYPTLTIKAPFIDPLKGNVLGYCGNLDGNAQNDNFCWNPALQTFENYEDCWPESYLQTHISDWGPGYFTCPYPTTSEEKSKWVEQPINVGHQISDVSISQNTIAEQMCNVLIDPNGVFGQCQKLPNINDIYAGCVADLSATNGDTDILCQYARQEAVECINMPSVTTLNWRSANFCPITCPANSQYSPKFLSCVDTCCDPFASQFCQGYFTEGCKCADGYYANNNKCYTMAQCKGCLDDQGNMVTVNTTWLTTDCSKWCTCLETGVTTCTQAGCCSTHSECIQNGTSATCICIDGYYGDGFFCSYNDHCINNLCQNDATCVTIATGYQCICPPGYTGQYCQYPINPCQPNPCVHGECINAGGSGYVCNCTACYTGVHCELPINYCASYPCKNLATCTNVNCNYACTCPEGFTGRNCETPISPKTTPAVPTSTHHQPTNPCDHNKCQNGATCIAVNSTNYVCECPPGYAGCYCQYPINPCQSNPCQHGGTCFSSGNDYICQCPPNYTGKDCENPVATSRPPTTPVVNPCLSNPCQHGGTCFWLPGEGYTCKCPPNYTGPNCQQLVTTAKPPTTTFHNPCTSNPCQHGGTCYSSGNTYICQCPPNYTGKNCENPVATTRPPTTAVVNPCLSNPCQHGGTCFWLPGKGYTCECPPNYTGPNCQQLITTAKPPTTTFYNPCTSNPCQHDGSCYPYSDGGYVCICPPGYTGTNCQQLITTERPPTTAVHNPCLSNPCQHGGTCFWIPTDSYQCKCPPEYTGPTCQQFVTTVKPLTTPFSNPCTSNPCQHSGTCYPNSEHGYDCQCPPYYTGKNCENPVQPICYPNPCVHGSCSPNGTSYICKCECGWEGTNCDHEVDHCLSQPCQNGATCASNLEGYTCTCPVQYTGVDCDTLVTTTMPQTQAYFNCLGKPNGNYSVSAKCSQMYVTCLWGKSNWYECPTGFDFDPISHYCNPKCTIAQCRDSTCH